MGHGGKRHVTPQIASAAMAAGRQALRAAGGHAGLFLALVVYTAAGGLVFKELEQPAEEQRLHELNATMTVERSQLLEKLCADADEGRRRCLEDKGALVDMYEQAVQQAVSGGLELPLPSVIESRWNLLQAVFFASTVLTTIGYGNIVPVTFFGRIFCILYALVGIPLTLSVIADLGKLFASGVSAVYKRLRKHLPVATDQGNTTGRRSLSVVAAVIFLLLYLAVGALIFMLWEDDWGFLEGFYFCFVTMTTIGFGDLVPQKPKYMLLCTLYILVGLALTSTIIELVRRQYSESWRRLQALSGPLADTLRRLGESAGGGIDVTALHKMLTIVSVPKSFKGGEKGARQRQEWEEAMAAALRDLAKQQAPPVIQIVIYESTV